MNDPDPYFSVGLHKGEMDFSVSGLVMSLSYEEIKSLREMIVVGIGVLESTWRLSQQQPAQCGSLTTKPKEGEGCLTVVENRNRRNYDRNQK